MANALTGADVVLRLGVDASGVNAELASKLTAAERVAVASGDRIAAGVAQGANKATAAQLRVVAATEKYNAVLRKEGATTGQIASAQASLITAQRTYNRELAVTETRGSKADGRIRSQVASIKTLIAAGLAYKSVQFFKDSAVEASDLAESLSKTEVVFGRLSPIVKRFAADAPTALGQSTQAALEATSTFGNFFTALGIAQRKSVEMSTSVVQLASDLASFNNEDPTDVLVALRSGLAGEVEPLRKYGIDLSDATLKQEALAEGLIKTTKVTLPTSIKAQAAYALIIKQSTTAQGDFVRTSSGVANQQRIAAAEAANLKAELGKGLIPAERDLLAAGRDLIPVIGGVAKGFSLIAGNTVARRTVGALALIAGGFYAANKAVKLYQEVSVNVLRRTPAQVAANGLVARSYDAIAVSADRAAVAEGRAATAGVAGGRLGALGGVARAAGPAGLVVGTLLAGSAALNSTANDGLSEFEHLARTDPRAASAELKRLQAEIARTSSLARGTGARTDPVAGLRQQASLLSRAIHEAAPGIRAAAKQTGAEAGKDYGAAFKASADAEAFAAHALFTGGARATNIKTAREALADAIRARNDAAAALSDARAGGGGTAATATDIRVAELRLQSARQAAAKDGSTASEKASVLSAQQRLNDLRTKGKATTEQTATAEGKVADAIRSQRDAQQRVNEARKALDEARGITAQEALKRIRGDAKAQGQLKGDLEKLLGKGATRGELSALKELESSSPGTIHRIATTSGKKFHDDFAEALGRINRRTSAIEKLFDGAETIGEHRGRRLAEATQRGFVKGMKGFDFAGFFTDLATPAPTTTATGGRVSNKVHSAGFPGT